MATATQSLRARTPDCLRASACQAHTARALTLVAQHHHITPLVDELRQHTPAIAAASWRGTASSSDRVSNMPSTRVYLWIDD
jgi:hypothetical protein